MAATAVVDPFERHDLAHGSLKSAVVGLGLGFAVLGVVADLRLLLALGVVLVAAVVVLVAPEMLYALFLAAGIVKTNPLFASFPVDLTLFTAAGVVLAIALRVLREGMPRIPPAAAIYPVLAALGLLSLFWSDLPGKGLDKALIFESFTALAFIAPFFLFRDRSQLIRFMVATVAIALVASLTAEEGTNSAELLVAAGTGVNEIELALVAGFGLLAAFGYLFVVGRLPWGVLWIIPATVFATTILKAGSRGVLIGTVLALFFLVVWLGVVGGRGRNFVLAALVTAAVVAVAAGPGLTGGSANTKYQTQLFSTNPAEILRKRDWYFNRGWELSAAHPFGTGLSGYEAATGEKYPHNLVLEYGSELGIPGLVLFLALYVAAWRALASGATRYTAEAAVCGALLILFSTEALVSLGPNEIRPLWFTMGLALALPNLRTDQ